MKLGSKRGSAVLEAPEENYASSTDEMGWREPAPAGALHRAATADGAAYIPDEPYVPKRAVKASSGFKLKWSALAVPRTVAGRLVAGSVAFLVLGGVAVTVAGMRHYLLHDDRFSVATSSDIEVLGNEHLTRAQILGVFGADLERNIFKVPLAERRADLERLPWVAHATVMRLLPNKMRISVVERTPVAFVRQGADLGLVDANGVLLDMPENTAGDKHYSFPVLTGLAVTDPLSTRAARMAVYGKFMKELGDGTPEGNKRTESLSEVDVTNPEDVKALVALGGSDVLVHFGDESFLERYKAFEEHLPEWRTQYPKLASADMRYEGQVVLEMAQGVAVPTGAPAAPVAGAPATGGVPAPAVKPVAAVAEKPLAAAAGKKTVAAKPVAKSTAAKKLMADKLAKARAGLKPVAAKPVAAHSGSTSGAKGQ
jgi:cell division protein FtsQ